MQKAMNLAWGFTIDMRVKVSLSLLIEDWKGIMELKYVQRKYYPNRAISEESSKSYITSMGQIGRVHSKKLILLTRNRDAQLLTFQFPWMEERHHAISRISNWTFSRFKQAIFSLLGLTTEEVANFPITDTPYHLLHKLIWANSVFAILAFIIIIFELRSHNGLLNFAIIGCVYIQVFFHFLQFRQQTKQLSCSISTLCIKILHSTWPFMRFRLL